MYTLHKRETIRYDNTSLSRAAGYVQDRKYCSKSLKRFTQQTLHEQFTIGNASAQNTDKRQVRADSRVKRVQPRVIPHPRGADIPLPVPAHYYDHRKPATAGLMVT